MRLRASRSSIEPGEKNSSAYVGDYYDKVETILCSRTYLIFTLRFRLCVYVHDILPSGGVDLGKHIY